MNRVEKDSIGEMSIPFASYYGVNSARAKENFQISGKKLDVDFIISFAEVKKACAKANGKLGILEDFKMNAIIQACDEIISGEFHDQFIVDPMQGGAGTSSNMNTNEVIANRAIEILTGSKGDYSLINPNDDVNKGQSTNDVYPTAGKLTMLKKVSILVKQLIRLEDALLKKSIEFKNIMKLGRTQLSDAVPLTLGQEFHAYYTAIKRCHKRLALTRTEMMTINLGGTAIGTGIRSHSDFSQVVIKELNEITHSEFIIAEDMIDNTQNIESYSTLSDSLKALSLGISKIANDIRLLSSGPRSGIGEIKIPEKQNGSSIMPGKINPVIPEIVNQCAFAVVGNNLTISMAVEGGQLELNAFEPVIFYRLLESFQLLTNAIDTFVTNCIVGIEANEERCKELLDRSTYLATALSEKVGYGEAARIAKKSLKEDKSVREIAIEEGFSAEFLNNISY